MPFAVPLIVLGIIAKEELIDIIPLAKLKKLYKLIILLK